ncbi:hypothetical protein [Tenggerimyces flavus]|uniref:Extracellular solute-binding protein n=1 Tax=Tenggerimyces flavus TaxID=1708749 RepID=A0ABV7Y2C8_9ACTN|nr:hypothetical protein [Tenggerimyces flavus]MBM7790741.1 hypothetical protein [Tenggerimyces flavus]
MRRVLSIGLAAVLIIGVGFAIWFGSRGGGPGEQPGGNTNLTAVKGVIGSEKSAFFKDQRVRDVFAKHGLSVEIDTAGSRQIATSVDLEKYDFAFPSSAPAAEKIQRERKTTQSFAPFYSPMVIASFQPIVDLLAKQGVAVKAADGTWTFDMAKYLELAAKGTRWNQLPGNTTYPVRKNILIRTTDPRNSNSAAMYLAIASNVVNDNAIVQSAAEEQKVLSQVSQLFLAQGYTAKTSEQPFDDYLSLGMGNTPLLFIYEAQFVDRVVRNDGTITPDMVLMYPSPTVLSKHTVVPLNDNGAKVGELLVNDPELQSLAATFGFRTTKPAQFADVVKQHKVAVRTSVVDVIDPPSYDTLERLLTSIEKKYAASGAAAVGKDEGPL